MVELVAQGHCTTWVGIALLSCQCNAVLSGALVLYLVHCFVAMKPVTPLRARVSAGLKPVTPLRGEMLVFRVLRARNGAGGFIGQLGEACNGVVGFTWTM